MGYLAEMYGTEISPDFISKVADEVMAEVTAWQSRSLEPVYPVVFFDALRVKIRDEGLVKNKAIYLAIGMRASGHNEMLGLWIEHSEGAKFWVNRARSPGELREFRRGSIQLCTIVQLKLDPSLLENPNKLGQYHCAVPE